MKSPESWGRYPASDAKLVQPIHWRVDLPAALRSCQHAGLKALAYAQGRSYGDSCLNNQQALLVNAGLDRLIRFDRETGLLTAESGVTLGQLLEVIVPAGWFLPVLPGTKFVSLGGAVANDIHGKNHHSSGTFGCHVRALELVRSSGEVLLCSREQNSDLFRASIGGLGLTGFISSVSLQLRPVSSAFIAMDSIRFRCLDEFFEISRDSAVGFEYSVAWLDCVSSGESFGRGIFMRGNHASAEQAIGQRAPALSQRFSVPLDSPVSLLNKYSVAAFNWLYYHRQLEAFKKSIVHYQPFFFPLDAVGNWNKIYGRRGFMQFQCVLPSAHDNRALREVLQAIVASQQGSFLAVLKEFGEVASPGMLSFPRAGVTLCADFPNHGASTLQLLQRLDALVRQHAGAIYPAKDSSMAAESFQQYFPGLSEFEGYRDAGFSSSFWRRVKGEG